MLWYILGCFWDFRRPETPKSFCPRLWRSQDGLQCTLPREAPKTTHSRAYTNGAISISERFFSHVIDSHQSCLERETSNAYTKLTHVKTKTMQCIRLYTQKKQNMPTQARRYNYAWYRRLSVMRLCKAQARCHVTTISNMQCVSFLVGHEIFSHSPWRCVCVCVCACAPGWDA